MKVRELMYAVTYLSVVVTGLHMLGVTGWPLICVMPLAGAIGQIAFERWMK